MSGLFTRAAIRLGDFFYKLAGEQTRRARQMETLTTRYEADIAPFEAAIERMKRWSEEASAHISSHLPSLTVEVEEPPLDALTAVKAMLVDALDASTGDYAAVRSSTNPAVGNTRIGIFRRGDKYATFVIDADKLAATVAEWFAAREGRS